MLIFKAVSAVLLALAACSGVDDDAHGPTLAPSSSSTLPPVTYPLGLSDQTITVDGVVRRYRIHIPESVDPPRAIVVVLHGGGGIGWDTALDGATPLAVFRTVADRENFVVVYPEGLPSIDRAGNEGWVDCRADNSVASDADDIGFLSALIDELRADFELSAGEVFMAGGSNGAMMTQSFAFAHPDQVAAVASSAGNLPVSPRPGSCTTGPTRPVPILLVSGTADAQMPYGGGCVANIGGACNRGIVVSAEATRDRWLRFAGLTDVVPTEEIIDIDPDDGGAAHRFVYAGEHPVEWWRLDGGGHTVASRTVLVAENRLTGGQNRDIEFAEVAWDFFERRLS